MRGIVGLASLAAILCFPVPHSFAAPAAGAGQGKIVILFKDGHRQVFNLADIERVEFPTGPAAAGSVGAIGATIPSRGHFLGKWEVGDGAGRDFYIVLKENGEAWRSLHDVNGRWTYVDGEARVVWEDGAQDVIRKVGPGFQKFAYGEGKSFLDPPDNVTKARSLTPHGS